MARKTASKDKKMKMKFKYASSSNTTVTVTKSSPMITNDNRETTTADGKKNETSSYDEHNRHHGKDDECNCYLRKANLFLPASLAPLYDLSSGTNGNSKA